MIVIGLTGGIASGKSAVSRMLSELGATVIDADDVGHEAFRPGSDAWREVVAAFGSGILSQNEEVDRGKLADIVFNDLKALEQLNLIMHPLMRRIVEQRIEVLRRQGVEVVVLEAALLIEANWTDLVDRVWVTVAPEAIVVNRLRGQKGFTVEQARARINSQMSIAERSKYADVVIENDSDLDALRGKVEELWQELWSSRSNQAGGVSNRGVSLRQRIKEILSQRQRRIIAREGLTPSAVLVPIYEKRGEYYIVLTKRTQKVEHHKGQISFPGGAYDDEDGDLETTALREAFEEIGVSAADVEILGNLDDQETATSHFAVTPFVGAIPCPYEFRVNREEVEALVEASVTALMDPACISTQTPDSEGRLHAYVHYQYGEHRITGITAMILEQFLDLVFGSSKQC